MPYASARTLARRAASFLNSPMDTWRERAARLSIADRDALSDYAARIAERATRASTYLASLKSSDGKIDDRTHADAVRRQNTAADRSRRANGYTYPSRITF